MPSSTRWPLRPFILAIGAALCAYTQVSFADTASSQCLGENAPIHSKVAPKASTTGYTCTTNTANSPILVDGAQIAVDGDLDNQWSSSFSAKGNADITFKGTGAGNLLLKQSQNGDSSKITIDVGTGHLSFSTEIVSNPGALLFKSPSNELDAGQISFNNAGITTDSGAYVTFKGNTDFTNSPLHMTDGNISFSAKSSADTATLTFTQSPFILVRPILTLDGNITIKAGSDAGGAYAWPNSFSPAKPTDQIALEVSAPSRGEWLSSSAYVKFNANTTAETSITGNVYITDKNAKLEIQSTSTTPFTGQLISDNQASVKLTSQPKEDQTATIDAYVYDQSGSTHSQPVADETYNGIRFNLTRTTWQVRGVSALTQLTMDAASKIDLSSHSAPALFIAQTDSGGTFNLTIDTAHPGQGQMLYIQEKPYRYSYGESSTPTYTLNITVKGDASTLMSKPIRVMTLKDIYHFKVIVHNTTKDGPTLSIKSSTYEASDEENKTYNTSIHGISSEDALTRWFNLSNKGTLTNYLVYLTSSCGGSGPTVTSSMTLDKDLICSTGAVAAIAHTNAAEDMSITVAEGKTANINITNDGSDQGGRNKYGSEDTSPDTLAAQQGAATLTNMDGTLDVNLGTGTFTATGAKATSPVVYNGKTLNITAGQVNLNPTNGTAIWANKDSITTFDAPVKIQQTASVEDSSALVRLEDSAELNFNKGINTSINFAQSKVGFSLKGSSQLKNKENFVLTATGKGENATLIKVGETKSTFDTSSSTKDQPALKLNNVSINNASGANTIELLSGTATLTATGDSFKLVNTNGQGNLLHAKDGVDTIDIQTPKADFITMVRKDAFKAEEPIKLELKAGSTFTTSTNTALNVQLLGQKDSNNFTAELDDDSTNENQPDTVVSLQGPSNTLVRARPAEGDSYGSNDALHLSTSASHGKLIVNLGSDGSTNIVAALKGVDLPTATENITGLDSETILGNVDKADGNAIATSSSTLPIIINVHGTSTFIGNIKLDTKTQMMLNGSTKIYGHMMLDGDNTVTATNALTVQLPKAETPSTGYTSSDTPKGLIATTSTSSSKDITLAFKGKTQLLAIPKDGSYTFPSKLEEMDSAEVPTALYSTNNAGTWTIAPDEGQSGVANRIVGDIKALGIAKSWNNDSAKGNHIIFKSVGDDKPFTGRIFTQNSSTVDMTFEGASASNPAIVDAFVENGTDIPLPKVNSYDKEPPAGGAINFTLKNATWQTRGLSTLTTLTGGEGAVVDMTQHDSKSVIIHTVNGNSTLVMNIDPANRKNTQMAYIIDGTSSTITVNFKLLSSDASLKDDPIRFATASDGVTFVKGTVTAAEASNLSANKEYQVGSGAYSDEDTKNALYEDGVDKEDTSKNSTHEEGDSRPGQELIKGLFKGKTAKNWTLAMIDKPKDKDPDTSDKGDETGKEGDKGNTGETGKQGGDQGGTGTSEGGDKGDQGGTGTSEGGDKGDQGGTGTSEGGDKGDQGGTGTSEGGDKGDQGGTSGETGNKGTTTQPASSSTLVADKPVAHYGLPLSFFANQSSSFIESAQMVYADLAPINSGVTRSTSMFKRRVNMAENALPALSSIGVGLTLNFTSGKEGETFSANAQSLHVQYLRMLDNGMQGMVGLDGQNVSSQFNDSNAKVGWLSGGLRAGLTETLGLIRGNVQVGFQMGRAKFEQPNSSTATSSTHLFFFSVEGEYRLDFSQQLSVSPGVQLVYNHMSMDEYTQDNLKVKPEPINSTSLRLGARVNYTQGLWNAYAAAQLRYELAGDSKVGIDPSTATIKQAAVSLTTHNKGLGVQLSVGGQYQTNSQLSLSGGLDYVTAPNMPVSVNARFGLLYDF